MADNYAARKDGVYKVVGLLPDLCFTPGIQPPVPYPVTATLAPSKSTVESVRFNGHPAFVYDISFVPTTIGDAAGRNKGVVSGTVEGDCWSIEHSPDTYIGGFPLNRVQDIFAMNGKARGGRGGNLTKKETWERRKALIAKGKQSSDPKVRAAAERLELNNTGMEKARLADYVYEPRNPKEKTPPIPEGWKDISNDSDALAKYGLTKDDLNSESAPQFRTKVYLPDENVFGKDMSTSVVFRGTQSGPDWAVNAKQAFGGENEYYKKAVGIGNSIRMSNQNIDCVGHSLGGGLASACSRSSGKPGWTFNAAGLNKATVGQYGGEIQKSVNGKEVINAYRVKGEVLTSAQEPGLWGIGIIAAFAGLGTLIGGPFGALVGVGLGTVIVSLPDSVGLKHDMDGGKGDPVSRHFMSQVMPCIEQEKNTDELILEKS
ncbi:phospholipase [Pantoea sp. VS1]|uniref:PAAR-like domain-containing protein n=1 Tax=Pantoea sp. VS1 TaxID=2003658 RepID=UPI000B507763|nr:PAAR-like domain-containing protein [Pantoea sp. VS1]OWS73509.1 phospholipase [Pantoea sp. VS1]